MIYYHDDEKTTVGRERRGGKGKGRPIPRNRKIKIIKELDYAIQHIAPSSNEMRADLKVARDAMIKELERQESHRE
jgi:hypothetical protein